MQVRPCANADEMRAALAPIWHYFGQICRRPGRDQHFRPRARPQRVHAAFDGDAAVAGSGSFAFDLRCRAGR